MSRIVKFALPAMILGLVLAVSYALLSATSKGGSTDPIENLAVGTLAKLDTSNRGAPIPEAALLSPAGDEMTLDAFSGQVIVVNFWATWCAPCEREMPSLGALQRAKGSDSFKVVPISIDAEEDLDYARERLTELGGRGLDFYAAPPTMAQIYYESGARGFPTTIIYGADGKEIARVAGEADWASYEAAALVDAILN